MTSVSILFFFSFVILSGVMSPVTDSAKSYQSQGIPDEKIIPFLQSAINNIKNKNVKEILNKFLGQ